MDNRALALLRFDFVLGDDVDAVVDELGRRFGDPVKEAMWGDELEAGDGEFTFDVDGPDQLGLPPEFGAVTIRVVDLADAVAGVITFAAFDERRLSGAGSAGAEGVDPARIREWERQLRSIRSLVPGEERGPETTVYWVETDSSPGELERRPFKLAGAPQPPSDDEIREALGPSGERSNSGLRLPGDETLLLPRDRGQPWGTLLAVDLEGHLRPTVASGGRRLRGPWSELAALYGIHYWCRARGAELAAFEDRLSVAATGLPTAVGDIDLAEYGDWDARIYALDEDWTALQHLVDEERRQLRRLHGDCSARLDVRTPDRGDADDDGSALLASYLERLERELEGVQADARRISDRLDSLTAVLRTRATFVAAWANAELGRRVSDGNEQRQELVDRSSWLAGAVVALVVVLVADVLMTGGLETFVDRLFDRGLGAVTTQVVLGVLLLAVALATVVLLRRRGGTFR